MSIEVDCGTIHVLPDRTFQVYALVCGEFPTQIDHILVTYGHAIIFDDKPSLAKTNVVRQAIAHAQETIANLEHDEEVIEIFCSPESLIDQFMTNEKKVGW